MTGNGKLVYNLKAEEVLILVYVSLGLVLGGFFLSKFPWKKLNTLSKMLMRNRFFQGLFVTITSVLNTGRLLGLLFSEDVATRDTEALTRAAISCWESFFAAFSDSSSAWRLLIVLFCAYGFALPGFIWTFMEFSRHPVIVYGLLFSRIVETAVSMVLRRAFSKKFVFQSIKCDWIDGTLELCRIFGTNTEDTLQKTMSGQARAAIRNLGLVLDSKHSALKGSLAREVFIELEARANQMRRRK